MNNNSRGKTAKLNIIVSLACQLITVVCGLITPRVMLVAFGSEANGAVASITTFLGYIILLEGGIGGVARAALYRPLAENDQHGINVVMAELNKFFRNVGCFFGVYVLVIACTFKYISHTDVFDWITSFTLVLVISISTFAQYFIGISNMVLLKAAQKTYIVEIIGVGGTVVNTILVVVLVYFGFDLIMVKLVSSLIFTIRPFLLNAYVKKHFAIAPAKSDGNVLKDKWTGLGQHIAFFFHSHTDVVVLTVFGNLQAVSVYSVYNMVTNAVQNISTSFSSGMEAVFGDMYVKKEKTLLDQTFDIYDTLMSVISIILLGSTMVLIVPFVKLYTQNVTDANYIEPVFGVLLTAACLIYCLRIPYHNMIVAAGKFRQTNLASYGEAVINIVSSIVLVIKYGLVGVALGTVIASGYRFVYYAIYLSRHVLNRSIVKWIKREAINVGILLIINLLGRYLVACFDLGSYFHWAICGAVIALMAAFVTLALNFLFYGRESRFLLRHFLKNRGPGPVS